MYSHMIFLGHLKYDLTQFRIVNTLLGTHIKLLGVNMLGVITFVKNSVTHRIIPYIFSI